MSASSFTKVDAYSMRIGGNLLMNNHASFTDEVSLVDTNVGGNVEMDHAHFAKEVFAEGLDIHGRLLMNDSASFRAEVDLVGAKIGYLDLGTAAATRIDLSSVIGGELKLNDLNWSCRGCRAPHHWDLSDPAWQTASSGEEDALPTLVLRNAHFETFQDSSNAWPPRMDLEGFRYDRLGGLTGTGKDDMRQRTSREWINWLARDPIFSPQPYTQLAAVLTAAGRRDTAEAVLYAGRGRELDESLARGRFPAWLWLSFYSAVAGYGIGF